LVLLALAYAAQLTLGHFQIQMWTGGLVLFTALWRAVADGRPWWRVPALAAALGWGAAIAAVQLSLSWELAQFVGTTRRPFRDLSFFPSPPARGVDPALPRLFMGLRGGPEDPYWFGQGTTGYEACLYIGTLPLILAFAGLLAGRDRA